MAIDYHQRAWEFFRADVPFKNSVQKDKDGQVIEVSWPYDQGQSDEGHEIISHLDSLERLFLAPGVKDSHLKRIEGLKNLKFLAVGASSEPGVSRLRSGVSGRFHGSLILVFVAVTGGSG